jgi:hypothetical protein
MIDEPLRQTTILIQPACRCRTGFGIVPSKAFSPFLKQSAPMQHTVHEIREKSEINEMCAEK